MFPEQIEKKLSHIIQSQFFIHGEEDEKFGHRPVLLIEGRAIESLAMMLEGKLDKIEMPEKIYELKKFLYTETGKIRRKATFDLLKQQQ